MSEGSEDMTLVESVHQSESKRPGVEKRKIRCTQAQCRFHTTTEARLNRHMQRKHRHPDQGLFKCLEPGCKYPGTYTRSMFIRHKQVHKPKKPIPCLVEGCEYNTFRPDNLSAHVQRYHTDPSEAEFRCREADCKYIGGTASDLRRHTYSHTTERPFSCDQCDYRAYQNSKILRHKMNVHKDEDLHAMKAATAKIDGLMAAAANEGKAEPEMLKCRLCCYVYEKATQLANHLRSHKERGYECINCGYFSLFSEVMRAHCRMKKHYKTTPLGSWPRMSLETWPRDSLADRRCSLPYQDEDDEENEVDKAAAAEFAPVDQQVDMEFDI